MIRPTASVLDPLLTQKPKQDYVLDGIMPKVCFKRMIRLQNHLQGGPKKVSHYQESLNRIKTRH